MLNARLSLSIVLVFALAGAVSPTNSFAATTTINGALGDLDNNGDGGAGEAAIVQTGAACWDARITSNRNFTLTVSGASLTGRGVGAPTTVTGGIPTAGFLQMDNDGSVNWFVDPTPLSSLEFTPDPNAQWRFINGTVVSGANNADLLRSVMHEMGHAHGWICGNAACNRATDTFNYDGLMVPPPGSFVANTTVNLVSAPGFNVPLRGDGLAGGIGVGGIVNELSHTGPAGPQNSVPDMMFGRTGNAVRETHSVNDVSMFARAYGDGINLPPTVVAGADITQECSEPGGSTLSLDGNGSTDPDADGLTFSWTCNNVVLGDANTVTPDGFFVNGQTEQCRLDVTDQAACPPDADLVNVTVIDTTPPQINCNAPATIIPRDAPISFVASATDVCDASPDFEITGFDCFRFTKKGKRIDKTESCEVAIAVDAITITTLDSGGVDDHIEWTVVATDDTGNVSEETCKVLVVNPGNS
jgi:hypothetical protein